MRFLREPLVHFLLLGGLLFLIAQWSGKASSSKIVITPGQIEAIKARFEQGFQQRSPTPEELRDLVEDAALTEAYVREAMARGLDRDDASIRELLRSKMVFVAEGLANQVEPSDAEMQAYLNAHADDYRGNGVYSFAQVFLDATKHGENLKRDAEKMLADLKAAGSAAYTIKGDPCLQEASFKGATTADVLRAFGTDFVHGLDTTPVGEWVGPIPSRAGVHLVFQATRTQGKLPPLAEVKEQIRKEIIEERRAAAKAKFEQEMLQKYTPEIRWPKGLPGVITAPESAPATTRGGTR